MCFSATASFLTAGVTGAVGLLSLARARERRALPLAATPLVFAVQQGVEGLLWLTLPPAPQEAIFTGSTTVFLFFALVFWPAYAPTAVLLVEPDAKRRRLMKLCLAIGLVLAAYLLWHTLTTPHSAAIRNGHVVYVTGLGYSLTVPPAYLASTCLPLLLSSRRTVVALGAVMLVGSVVSYLAYWEAFVSVWCMFAAVASLVIVFHFEHSYRRRLRMAAA